MYLGPEQLDDDTQRLMGACQIEAFQMPFFLRQKTRNLLVGGLLFAIGTSPALSQAPSAPPVDVAAPLTAEVIDYDIYTGRFEAVQEVELRARVSGYLDKVSFEDGDIVQEGQVLFTIAQSGFQTTVARATANVAAAEAARDLAEVEFNRAQQLAQRNVGTVQDVDRTRATLSQSEALLLVAKAELTQAELDLSYTEVRAPFTGRMSDRKVDPGNLISGGVGTTTLLSTIVSIDPVHFVFTASEADYLRYVRLDQSGERASSRDRATPVAVRLLDEADFIHKGEMNFVDNALNPNSGTISGRAVLANPDGILVPGVFGRLRLPGSGPYQALLIPDEAILSDQERKIVMVVDAEGQVSPRAVTLGDMHRGLRVVKSGITAEDQVIVNGVQRARPGAKVTPQPVELTMDEN